MRPVAHEFPETRWSLIQAAREEDGGLAEWCQNYGRPVRAYLRALGCAEDEADDAAQDFFHRLLRRGAGASLPEDAGGSFRAYLKRTLRNFLIDRRRAEAAARRGGGAVALDVDGLEIPGGGESPEIIFDRQFVVRVIELASERLAKEFAQGGRAEFFEVVAPLLDGRRGDSSLGERFGMSEAAFRAALYRVRKRYRALIEEELRETVAEAADYEEELRHLLAVWS